MLKSPQSINKTTTLFSGIDLDWQFFTHYLLSKRSGSVVKTMAMISWVATMIGVFSLILVASIMNGFNRSQSLRILNIEPHVFIQSRNNLQSVFNQLSSQADFQAQPFIQSDVIVRSLEGHFSGAIAKSTSQVAVNDFMTRVHRIHYKSAELSVAELAEIQLKTNELIIGADLARDLNVFEGDEILILPPETLLSPSSEIVDFEKMRIKKIFSTEFPELDSRLIVFAQNNAVANTLKEQTGLNRFQTDKNSEMGLELRFVKPDLFADYNKILKKYSIDPIDVSVTSWADRNKALFMALRLEKVAMLSLLSISVLITCFSLITVITMLISQKKKDIRLLLAVGYSKLKTERLFVRLGLMLCLIGLLPGLFMGVGASLLIENYPIDILPEIYYDSSIPSQVSYEFVIGVALVSLCIAWMTAKIPISREARRSVAQQSSH